MHAPQTIFELALTEKPAVLYSHGQLFRQGERVTQDPAKAMRFFRAAAIQSHASAPYELGMMHLHGEAGVRDKLRALVWFTLASQREEPRAASQLERLHASLPAPDLKTVPGHLEHIERAKKLLRQAKFMHSAAAQNALGEFCAAGAGLDQDYLEASEWFTLAAAQYHPQAQFNLGYLFANGLGVKQKTAEALRLYRLAVGQGNVSAQAHLARMYEQGRDVAQNYTEAIWLYRLAANQGDEGAQLALAYLLKKSADLPPADRREHHAPFEPIHINRQNRRAPHLVEACHYFRMAADQGNPEAQCQLGLMVAQGLGVEQNFEEAVRWYSLSAARGNAQAQFNLAYFYAHGEGVEQDNLQAYMWTRISDKSGYLYAKQNLALIGANLSEHDIEMAEWKPDSFIFNNT